MFFIKGIAARVAAAKRQRLIARSLNPHGRGWAMDKQGLFVLGHEIAPEPTGLNEGELARVIRQEANNPCLLVQVRVDHAGPLLSQPAFREQLSLSVGLVHGPFLTFLVGKLTGTVEIDGRALTVEIVTGGLCPPLRVLAAR